MESRNSFTSSFIIDTRKDTQAVFDACAPVVLPPGLLYLWMNPSCAQMFNRPHNGVNVSYIMIYSKCFTCEVSKNKPGGWVLLSTDDEFKWVKCVSAHRAVLWLIDDVGVWKAPVDCDFQFTPTQRSSVSVNTSILLFSSAYRFQGPPARGYT